MLERFIEILSLQAESKELDNQKEIAYHVLNMYNKLNLPPLIVEEDSENNNFYITKGKPTEGGFYPCVVAHLDQVHYTKAWYKIFRDGDTLFAMAKTKFGDYVQVGTGSDDLAGVWMLLELLISQPYLKACLFSDEEIGCVGSKKAKLEFFSDCSFVMQADRRGNTKDFIIHTNGTEVSSKEFQEAARPFFENYKYKTGYGSSTDVGQLVKNGIGISTVNLSCGYFKPHTDNETSLISDSFICLNLMKDMATNISNVRWEFTPPPPPPPKVYENNAYKRNSNTYPSSKGGWSDWNTWDEPKYKDHWKNSTYKKQDDPNKKLLGNKASDQQYISSNVVNKSFNINKDSFMLDIHSWPLDVSKSIREYLSARGYTYVNGKSLLANDIEKSNLLSRGKYLYCNANSKKCIPLLSADTAGVKELLDKTLLISHIVFYETYVIFSDKKETSKQKTLFRTDVDQDIYTCPLCLSPYSLRQHPTEEQYVYCHRKCKSVEIKILKINLNTYRHANGHYMVNHSEINKAFS